MARNASAPKPRSVDSGRVVDGVVALLFTPFTADGSRFDAAGMRRQLDFVLESGVSAVVACGKAGEFEGQSLEEIEARLMSAGSEEMKSVNEALHAGNTGPRHQNVETKYEGPNGEMIDVSQVGWVGTRGLD